MERVPEGLCNNESNLPCVGCGRYCGCQGWLKFLRCLYLYGLTFTSLCLLVCLINPVKEKNSRVINLDLSMPTLSNIGGKGCLRDCVVEKGTFLVLGVVGNVGAKDISRQIEMHVALWLSSLA